MWINIKVLSRDDLSNVYYNINSICNKPNQIQINKILVSNTCFKINSQFLNYIFIFFKYFR